MATINRRIDNLERRINPEPLEEIHIWWTDPDDENLIHRGTLDGPAITRQEYDALPGKKIRVRYDDQK